MSFIRCGSVVHHFELRSPAPRARAPGAGSSGSDSPALLFIHAVGTSLRIWDGVVDALSFAGPVLRYDLRGHGLSEVGDTPYEVARLARDALDLLDQLGIGSAVVCGLSVGGLVAQELALAAPSRVRALVLCATAARIGTVDGWQTRIDQVREGGLRSITDLVMTRWFSPRYRELEPDAVRGHRCLLERTSPEGYLATLSALAQADLTDRVGRVRAPTLVISGELDEATPPASGSQLASLIPGATFELLAGVSHIFSVEKPRELAALIDDFVAGLASQPASGAGGPPSDDPFERGLAVRRAVLGEAHVDRALGAASDFDRDFQAYITRAAWGEIWSRPGLSRHARHLLTIAMLAAQGREEELGLHLRATVNTGVTPAEIKEVLMQVAVYAGVPAANSAIKTAKRVLYEMESEKEG
jgi:3-oxoadipate enol-lactonase/4-carboxymuconolactone decarboxylase